MFTDFLYLLRAYGMKTSLNEWNMLLEALDLNLNHCSFTEFYHMARCILVKRVEDYDRFDQAFLAYFRTMDSDESGENTPGPEGNEIPSYFRRWLRKAHKATKYDKDSVDAAWGEKSLREIREMMQQRIKEQVEEHDGGKKWVGTGGQTAYGHSGYAPRGIRVMGEGHLSRAMRVAGQREFRDFRDDNAVQVRDFQVALKKLRRLSNRDDGPRTEFSVERTIDETAENAGMLKIILERPRKNQTKLLLLMDSGGSMSAYADLCSRLFHAVHDMTHFKDLEIYYFHNCVYDYVYRAPECRREDEIFLGKILLKLKSDYKLILVGDAFMDPTEFYEPYDARSTHTGEEWLRLLRKQFPQSIWLNPLDFGQWDRLNWGSTISAVRRIFPMYPFSARGIDDGIRELRKVQ